MKMRSLVLCGCVLVLAATQANAARNTLKLKSPDGRIEMLLSVDAGHVSWQASMDGHAMLQKEPLDIHARGRCDSRCDSLWQSTALSHRRHLSLVRRALDGGRTWEGIARSFSWHE